MPDSQPPSQSSFIARLMQVFFRLLYHPFAWAYDLVAAFVSLGRWRQWVRSAAEHVQGDRVLELGFGPGHLQAHLHAAGVQIYGLDESAQMARQAKRRITECSFAPRLARGLAQNLPFPTRHFDSVIATFPTTYIFEPAALSEIARVLVPGGSLVILLGAWITGKSLPDRFLAVLFHLTGQSPPQNSSVEDALVPFFQAGLDAEIRYQDLRDVRGQPSSRLMFILARQSTKNTRISS